jgi:hypothetical protein
MTTLTADLFEKDPAAPEVIAVAIVMRGRTPKPKLLPEIPQISLKSELNW